MIAKTQNNQVFENLNNLRQPTEEQDEVYKGHFEMNRSSSVVNIETISEAEIELSMKKQKEKTKVSCFDFEPSELRESQDLNLHFKKEFENEP